MKLINADTVVHWQSYDDEHETFPEHTGTIAEFLDAMTDEGCPECVNTLPSALQEAIQRIEKKVVEVYGYPKTEYAEGYVNACKAAIKMLKSLSPVDAVPVERKSVSGYEGLYEVDNLSRVFSLRTGKQMKQMINTRGYKTVALTKEGKTKCVFVHRMVAEAFVPNDANFPFVNHKDEDKTNNLPENLEWCTARYNANYGTAIKRRVATLKRNGTSTKGRPSEKRKQIVAIDENGAETIFENSYEAAEKTGVDRRNIYACCQGKKKRLNGYKFDWVCGRTEGR